MRFYNYLLILALCILNACSSDVTTNTDDRPISINVEAFSKIEFHGNIQANIIFNKTHQVSLSARDKLLYKTNIYTKNNTLYINVNNKLGLTTKAPQINILGDFKTTPLASIKLNGSTKIHAKNFIADILHLTNNGSSAINISGQINSLYVYSTGALKFNSPYVTTKNSIFITNGTCYGLLHITNQLNIKSHGYNKIHFKGNPDVNIADTGYVIASPLT